MEEVSLRIGPTPEVDAGLLHSGRRICNPMMRCDLCGTTAKCVQKDIDGREFDICEPCWKPFADRLAGKGRPKSGGAPRPEPSPARAAAQVQEYEEVVY